MLNSFLNLKFGISIFRKITSFVFIILIPFYVFATNISIEYHFDNPEIFDHNEFHTISFENTFQLGNVGEPLLPYFGSKILLPSGEIAENIKITKSGLTEINRTVNIHPAQPPQPLSIENINFIQPNPDIYNSKEKYPLNDDGNLKTEFLSGFSIAFSSFTPLEYYPSEKKAYYYNTIKIEIVTELSTKAQEAARFLHNDEKIVNFVTKNIDNPQEIYSYDLTPIRDGNIDFIIIAEEQKIDLWNSYVQLYENRGFVVEIETIENIEATFTGMDFQIKTRNYLIQKYDNNPLKFVLLAGDDDLIPHRGMSVQMPGYPDNDIPADMYYSCLDGTWDDNVNGQWGEPFEADLAPEFAIGRFCYNNDQEILNFINKVDNYLNSPIVNEVKSALFIGEYLWEGPTWGGDYMDELIGNSDTNGHSTIGTPTTWNNVTLYERDENWESYDLFPCLNSGPNLINHLGHSSVDYTLKLSTDQVNDTNITNNGENHNHSIIFTQGCYGGSFDNRNTYGEYGPDCITEKFTSISNGVVSMIANSRYGWGQQGSTDGASQFFHREYIDAFFGEDIFDLGFALNDAKIDAIPFITQPVMYWCTYETNLLGDPALPVWTDQPEEIIASYPSEVIIGTSQINISTNTANAHLIIKSGNNIIANTTTNDSGAGTIIFFPPLANIETLDLYIIKYNYLAYHGTIMVIPDSGPYVICGNHLFNEIGDYIDGSIQSLDIINMDMTLHNIGSENTTSDIQVILSSESEFVNIISNEVTAVALNPDETIELFAAFQFELLAGIEDQSTIILTISMTSGEQNWQSNCNLTVNASQLSYVSYSIDVISGDDEILDPGETADIYIQYENTGNGFSYDLNTVLLSFDNYVFISGNSHIDQIAPNTVETSPIPFNIIVSENCPENHITDVILAGEDALGSPIEASFSLAAGAVTHNFEMGIGDWTHLAISTGFSDQWHLSNNKNHTENGEFSMKCGGNGSANYSNSLHAGLVTPVLPLSSNSYISFYHWMDAETESYNEAWDGGLIEISVNGGNFETIEPVGGYPYTVVPNVASPFPSGTQLFSGTHDWEHVQIDLSSYMGTAQLRFVFGSDGYVTGQGWYIDDLFLENYTDIDEITPVSLTTMISQNYPNPFNPETTIKFSTTENKVNTELVIYNIKGQRIITLINEKLIPGEHSIIWNGKDDQNNSVASGIYFYKIRSGKFTATRKMILMK